MKKGLSLLTWGLVLVLGVGCVNTKPKNNSEDADGVCPLITSNDAKEEFTSDCDLDPALVPIENLVRAEVPASALVETAQAMIPPLGPTYGLRGYVVCRRYLKSPPPTQPQDYCELTVYDRSTSGAGGLFLTESMEFPEELVQFLFENIPPTETEEGSYIFSGLVEIEVTTELDPETDEKIEVESAFVLVSTSAN